MQGFSTTSEPVVVWVRELAQKDGVVCACSVGPVVEFPAGLGGPWRGAVGEGAGLRIAGVFLSVGRGGGRGAASGGGSGLGVSTPLAVQDGTIIAKLRPKEDSDCRSFWEQRLCADKVSSRP